MYTIEYCKNGELVAVADALKFAAAWATCPYDIKIANLCYSNPNDSWCHFTR